MNDGLSSSEIWALISKPSDLRGLKIRVESPPTRCEICHQADLFDPKKNTCTRCDGVAAAIEQQEELAYLRWRVSVSREWMADKQALLDQAWAKEKEQQRKIDAQRLVLILTWAMVIIALIRMN